MRIGKHFFTQRMSFKTLTILKFHTIIFKAVYAICMNHKPEQKIIYPLIKNILGSNRVSPIEITINQSYFVIGSVKQRVCQ